MGKVRSNWPLFAGMLVAGAAAVVASASTLAALAGAAGWSGWTPWLLPASIDVGGAAGGWCWLRPGAPAPARRFGCVVALAGALTSLVGNAVGHLISTGYLLPGPVLVVIVGAVPAAVLVALAHLAALLAGANEQEENEEREDGEVETRAVVLDLVRTSPLTIAELARATGRSRTTVIGHLNALSQTGAVLRDEAKRYRVTRSGATVEREQEAAP